MTTSRHTRATRPTRPRLNLLEKDNVLWMLASRCQNVHDFWDDLESADPECDSMLHMKSHGIDREMVNETKLFQLRLLDELIVTRAVDMFGIYLSEMLQLVFKQEPRILRSGSQMKVDEILAYDSMDDLVGEITRRRVDDLARKGFFSIVAFFKDTLGVVIKLPEKTLASKATPNSGHPRALSHTDWRSELKRMVVILVLNRGLSRSRRWSPL